jgi:hypothetical protein
MKYYRIELNGGTATVTDIFKDKKGRLIKLTDEFRNGYFFGKASKDIESLVRAKMTINIHDVMELEDHSLDDSWMNDVEYEKCSDNHIEKFEQRLNDGENPEEFGFEFYDCEILVSGNVKLTVEEVESEDEKMKRIADETVAEMKIGEQIKKLKTGETISIKVNISDYLKALNDEPKRKNSVKKVKKAAGKSSAKKVSSKVTE